MYIFIYINIHILHLLFSHILGKVIHNILRNWKFYTTTAQAQCRQYERSECLTKNKEHKQRTIVSDINEMYSISRTSDIQSYFQNQLSYLQRQNRTLESILVLAANTLVLRTFKTNIVLRTWIIVLPIIVLWIVFVLYIYILVLCVNRTTGIVLHQTQVNHGQRQGTHSADEIRWKDLWRASFNIQYSIFMPHLPYFHKRSLLYTIMLTWIRNRQSRNMIPTKQIQGSGK